jgi:hypothetical protein
LTDDSTGNFLIEEDRLDYALAGAVLRDLAELRRVRLVDGRLDLVDRQPIGAPALDFGLALLVGQEDRKPQRVLGRLAKGLRVRLLTGLAQRGVLRREQGKVLALFPVTRWPAADSAHEQDVRQRLQAVLVGGVPPDGRTAAVISLLSAIDAVPRVLGVTGIGETRALRRRAKELSAGEWVGAAVRKADRANQLVDEVLDVVTDSA